MEVQYIFAYCLPCFNIKLDLSFYQKVVSCSNQEPGGYVNALISRNASAITERVAYSLPLPCHHKKLKSNKNLDEHQLLASFVY